MEGADYNMQLEKWVLEGGNCGFHRMDKKSSKNCSQFSELLTKPFFSSQEITKIAGWNVALGICL